MGIKEDVDWRKIADDENVKSIPSGFLCRQGISCQVVFIPVLPNDIMPDGYIMKVMGLGRDFSTIFNHIIPFLS